MQNLDQITSIIQSHFAELKQSGVIDLHPGYTLENDWPTSQPAIVAVVSKDAGAVHLPSQVDGIPVDVRQATPVEELAAQDPEGVARLAQSRPEFRGGAFEGTAIAPEAEEERGAGKPGIDYTPASVKLKRVTGKFPIVCHASPDAGWPTLRDFIAATQSTLKVSIYDWTSKHILDGVIGSLGASQTLELTLDDPIKNPTANQTDPETIAALADSLGGRFTSAWALVRSSPQAETWIFPTAYHIKVAVRDSSAMWLSSGNWNNSNQPDIDPINNPSSSDQQIARKSDRDWHVIIEDPGLSRQFEAYLEHDFQVATAQAARGAAVELAAPELERAATTATFEFHKPLRIEGEELAITPLLTPDEGVYQPAMLNLLNSATKSLYIQLQYIHPSSKPEDADFEALIDAVAKKITAGLDVRIILSEFQAQGGWLDKLQAAGVDLKAVKIQNGVHNKGFVIDSKVVVVGSQNWSSEGVLRNRDASVIIENATAAKYYETIFLHDWTRIAKQSLHA